MKKFFRLVSVFAIAGVTFAYTSCTDYSEDIEQTNYIDFSALGSAAQLCALIDTAMAADRQTLRREIDDLRQRADRSRLVAQALLEKE